MNFFKDTDDTTHQVEPVRRTLLNVLLDNLKEANRKIYVHRLIYIGEHSFPTTSTISISDVMKNTVDTVNSHYNDENLSGIFLHYPKYFCHLLEGSEDSIIKHLLLLTENEENKKFLGRMKMLVCYHHINQRFLTQWISITSRPPTLLERLDAEQIDLYRSYRHNYNCIKKLYKLAQTQNSGGTEAVEVDCLPEYGLIEFLLSTKHTVDLYEFIQLYGVIPVRDGLKDLVWPAMSEFVPFNVFDEPIDAVIDLPSAAAQQEATEAIVE
ncbi:hypothetical protein RN001_009299 [Aquatica leii]|uniref:BLUF domain-containing protein n=1 Tax=Aquatica leii TaxID=1421715 RepID=A0AAN7SMV6_9COLE|nr:hypothetical protein RN001_009299 [Aquatica leii]